MDPIYYRPKWAGFKGPIIFFLQKSKVILGSRMRGTAVEYMPNHPTVKGSSPSC